jgi:hypothetical protein
MRRAAFTVLVIPYALDAFAELAYALRRRDGEDCWHAPAGDATRGESAPDAARRIAGAGEDAALLELDSRAVVPLAGCSAACGLTEYAFGLRADPAELRAPGGHEQLWVSYRVAEGLLRRRAERNAIWELQRRLGPAPVWR